MATRCLMQQSRMRALHASSLLASPLVRRGAAVHLSHSQQLPRLLQRGLAAAAGTPLAEKPAAAVPAALVKQLREMTGSPMMDCKNALVAEGGDVQKALDWLRKKGIAAANKQAGRAAAQGLVFAAVSAEGDAGVLIELNSETDFVARNEHFQALLRRLAAAALSAPELSPSPSSSLSGSYSRSSNSSGGGVPGETVGATGPSTAAGGASLPTGAPPPSTGPALSAWLSSPLPGGDSPGAACTVADAVAELAGRVRENIVLRRVARLNVPGGVVAAYTHNAVCAGGGSIGVLVGLRPPAPLSSSGSSSLARTTLGDAARRVAMHVAAAKPAYAHRTGIPPAALDRERALQAEVAAASGKSGPIFDRMVEGKLTKFYADNVLAEQVYVLGDGKAKVSALLADAARAAAITPLPASGGALLVGFQHMVVGEMLGAAEA